MNLVSAENIPRILSCIRNVWPVEDSSIDELCSMLTPYSLPKRSLLVEAGCQHGKAYFIEKGMTRSFWIVDGQEITTSFSTEGGIVFSMDELYYGLPSEEYVETIENVDAFSIAITDLLKLFESRLDMANWGRVIHQNEYRRIHRSHKERLTLSARERYEEFSRQFPDVCRRSQLQYIASYLGISKSTLSRLRSF